METSEEQERRLWLQHLGSGDWVAKMEHHKVVGEGRVDRRTPGGQVILVGGARYDNKGVRMGQNAFGRHYGRIVPRTDESRAIQDDLDKRAKLIPMVAGIRLEQARALPTEVLEKVVDLLCGKPLNVDGVQPGDIRVLTDDRESQTIRVNEVGPRVCHCQDVAHDLPCEVHTERLRVARLAYRGAGKP